MEFVADENVNFAIVRRLRAEGYSVWSVAENAPGSKDPRILEFAEAQNAVLITEDKDFGELVFRLGQLHAGVVFLRLTGLGSKEKADLVAKVIASYENQLGGSFTVVTKTLVRIRRNG